MKGNTLIAVSIIAVIVLLGWMFKPKAFVPPTPTATVSTSTAPYAVINGKNLSLIVVDTTETRELGLSGRESMPADTGMLFVFEKPDLYEFWMKDMQFPIDIIWLDEKFKIVSIQSNVSPLTYPDTTFAPQENSLYVLETNALFAEQNNLKIGDTLEIHLNK